MIHRLFVAIDFPQEIIKKLTSLCFGVPGAGWTPEKQLHLTLRFIGEVDGVLSKEIKEDLKNVEGNSFSMRLKGFGHFPPKKAPRVLWAGIETNDTLVQLRNRVNSVLVRLGLEPEHRKYSPHVTIARLKNTPITKMTDFLAVNGLFSAGPFKISKFSLYSSVLTQKGAIHNIEASYDLNRT